MVPPACVNQVENRVEATNADLCRAQFVFPFAAWRDRGTVTRTLLKLGKHLRTAPVVDLEDDVACQPSALVGPAVGIRPGLLVGFGSLFVSIRPATAASPARVVLAAQRRLTGNT